MDNIAKIDGNDAFAFSGEMPWHRLGTKLPGLMTVQEALLAGRANWEVTKEPIMLADINMTPIDGSYATVRNGPEKDSGGDLVKFPLGIVGERYTVVQNEDAFDFFNTAIHEKVACLETIGVLGKGEVVFAMAKVPKTFEPVKGDPVETYILLTTSHDGSGSIMATFTNIRVVCANTLNMALSGANNIVKIRHTKTARSRLAQAHKVLAAGDQYWANLSAAYTDLTKQDMTRLDVMNFVDKMFPGTPTKVVVNGVEKTEEVASTRTKNNRLSVIGLYAGGAKGSNFAPGTKWQALNSITEYIDYSRSTRKDTNNWESSMFGAQAQTLRQRAFDYLTK